MTFAMPPTLNPHAGDDKLRLIKGEIGRFRFRLNFLACQHASYLIMTFVIGAATALVVAAFSLGALGFLAVATLTGIVLVAASVRVLLRAWRAIHHSYAPAAALADQRAGLCGRLLTIVSAAGKGGENSALWPYLIQDTFQKRDAFALERIESRRIAHSIYALLGSCVIATLVVLFILKGPFAGQASQKRSDQELHVYKMTKRDLARLNLRPAAPGGEGGWKIEADPATMRELRKMLAARAYALNREGSSALAKLGRKSGNLVESPLAQGKQESQQPRPNSPDRSANGAQSDEGAPRGGAGASHGPGTDPEHLFGKRSDYRDLSAKDFAIAVEARAARVGAHLPTKIQVSLNPQQHADEPVARVSVPAEDRAAIKRVFER